MKRPIIVLVVIACYAVTTLWAIYTQIWRYTISDSELRDFGQAVIRAKQANDWVGGGYYIFDVAKARSALQAEAATGLWILGALLALTALLVVVAKRWVWWLAVIVSILAVLGGIAKLNDTIKMGEQVRHWLVTRDEIGYGVVLGAHAIAAVMLFLGPARRHYKKQAPP